MAIVYSLRLLDANPLPRLYQNFSDLLLRTNVLTGWFDEFRRYWVEELGNRPVDLPDFYYLRGVYRSRFQAIGLPWDDTNSEAHLQTWQRAEIVYLLFDNIWRRKSDSFSIVTAQA